MVCLCIYVSHAGDIKATSAEIKQTSLINLPTYLRTNVPTGSLHLNKLKFPEKWAAGSKYCPEIIFILDLDQFQFQQKQKW